jgi:hypothetical protein
VNAIKTTCLEEIGLRLHNSVTTPTLDSEHGWEDLCIQARNQQALDFR